MSSVSSIGDSRKVLTFTAAAIGILAAGVVAVRGSAPAADWCVTLPASVPYEAGAGEGRLAFCTGDKTLMVVDLSTGAELWSRSDLEAYATPLIHGDLVVTPTLGNGLIALDLATGEERWTAESARGCELALWGEGLVLLQGCGLEVRDLRSGDFCWEFQPNDDELTNHRAEAISVADDLAFVAYSISSGFELSFGGRSSKSGGVYAVDLDRQCLAWVSAIEDQVLHPPIACADAVVAKTTSGLVNEVYCLERETGAVRWEHLGASGTPRVVGDTVCFVNVDSRTKKAGAMSVLEEKYSYCGLDLTTGEEEWSRRAPADLCHSQCGSESVLFGSEHRVHAMRGESGSGRWRLGFDCALSAPLTTAGERLLVFTEDSKLKSYALR